MKVVVGSWSHSFSRAAATSTDTQTILSLLSVQPAAEGDGRGGSLWATDCLPFERSCRLDLLGCGSGSGVFIVGFAVVGRRQDAEWASGRGEGRWGSGEEGQTKIVLRNGHSLLFTKFVFGVGDSG